MPPWFEGTALDANPRLKSPSTLKICRLTATLFRDDYRGKIGSSSIIDTRSYKIRLSNSSLVSSAQVTRIRHKVVWYHLNCKSCDLNNRLQ
jgi:hypothetical protein